MTLPRETLQWPISYKAVCEIAKSEGCALKAYADVVGVWTIGYGHTEGVRPGDEITQSEADDLLVKDLGTFTAQVKGECTAPANANELGAMVSLAYNIGIGNFRKSSVLKAHNRGDHAAAARAFGLFNKAGGRVVQGLSLRRAREAALYLEPVDSSLLPMAQKVDPEKPMAASTIMQGGATTAITGGLATMSALSDSVKQFAENLNIQPLAVVGVLGLAAGAWIIWQRYKQREGGHA